MDSSPLTSSPIRRPEIWKIVALALLALAACHMPAQRFTFKAYSQAQGLDNLNINCMFQDRTGFLWLGTDNGLSRYDGARFLTFNKAEGLTIPYVLALGQDVAGRIWVGTSGGLFYLEGHRLIEVKLDGASLPIDVDSSLATLEDGRVLAVSRYRLIEIAPQPDHSWRVQPLAASAAFRALSHNTLVTSVLAARDHVRWLGCGKSLCQLADGHIKVWNEASGVPGDDWTTLYQSRDGGIWARSISRILFLPPGSSRFEDRAGLEGSRFTNNYYVSFAEDAQGRVLTQTADGIAIWDAGHWRFYGAAQGLSPYPVLSLLTDRTGQIWMGIGGHGLLRWLGYRAWENWTTSEGLQNPIVWSVLRDHQGRLWVGDDHGLSTKAPADTRLRAVTHSQGNAVLGLTEDRDGRIWACSGNGLVFRVDPGTLAIRRYTGIPATHQIYADSHNRIWISTEQGIYVIDDARSATTAHPSGTGAILSSNVYRIVGDKSGRLWAATLSGLFYEDHGDWKPLAPPGHGFVDRISDIDAAPDGSLWAVSDFSTLWHLNMDHGRVLSVDSAGLSVLSTAHILFTRTDARGWIWVGNDRGLAVFDGQRWQFYDSEDGLLWNDVNAQAFFPDPDGSIWIGTSEGLSHLLHPGRRAVEPPPAMRLDSVRYGGAEVNPAISHVFSWSQSPLEIRMSPLRLSHENATSYLYRLSGIDHAWIATSDTELRFPLLPPGAYTFQVVAIDNLRREQSPATAYSFTIRPPWWGTWFFRAVLAFLVTGLVLLGWQLRVRHLLRHQQQLEFMVSERTHELQLEKVELIRAREALREQATHDGLTKLWNRTAIVEILERELKYAAREGFLLSVVLIDLDYFKEINDRHGHLVGDAVLIEFSTRLEAAIRPYDSAGRYGGEEFLLILPLQSREIAEQRLRTLHVQLSGISFNALGTVLQITCSFGVTFVQNTPKHSVDHVLSTADSALYRAKTHGRNCIEYA
jgi:diguanylate cyclase (GGDEF)-like protein